MNTLETRLWFKVFGKIRERPVIVRFRKYMKPPRSEKIASVEGSPRKVLSGTTLKITLFMKYRSTIKSAKPVNSLPIRVPGYFLKFQPGLLVKKSNIYELL